MAGYVSSNYAEIEVFFCPYDNTSGCTVETTASSATTYTLSGVAYTPGSPGTSYYVYLQFVGSGSTITTYTPVCGPQAATSIPPVFTQNVACNCSYQTPGTCEFSWTYSQSNYSSPAYQYPYIPSALTGWSNVRIVLCENSAMTSHCHYLNVTNLTTSATAIQSITGLNTSQEFYLALQLYNGNTDVLNSSVVTQCNTSYYDTTVTVCLNSAQCASNLETWCSVGSVSCTYPLSPVVNCTYTGKLWQKLYFCDSVAPSLQAYVLCIIMERVGARAP